MHLSVRRDLLYGFDALDRIQGHSLLEFGTVDCDGLLFFRCLFGYSHPEPLPQAYDLTGSVTRARSIHSLIEILPVP